MREHLRQRVMAEMDPMLDAQIEHAKGIKYLMVRDKKGGKFTRVTEAMARQKIGSDEEIIEVWEKDPSVQAFTDLLNRALGKPEESVSLDATVNAGEDLMAVLLEGRKRAAQGTGNGHSA